jgi:regulator of sirC expression with transglutaminase-like and TPR domain
MLARGGGCAHIAAMASRFSLPDWDTLATLDDDELPLLAGALLIARDEYPQLDAAGYDALADEYARELREQIAASDSTPAKLIAINRYLFDVLGFSGNHEHYYDPRNSYLNEVFDRKLGIPVSLAVVQMEVARRLGIPLDGVSFPGHFLVRLPVDDGLMVMDPFNRGRPLAADELRDRVCEHLGGEVPDDAQLLQILAPASHRAILVRMLRNLKALYARAEDWDRVARTTDRVIRLMPNAVEELRDRGLAYLRLGWLPGAREDLRRYLALQPAAEDAELVRLALVEASAGRTSLN